MAGEIVKRRRLLAPAGEEQASPVTFSVPGLREGRYQGMLRMDYDDPLPLDNRRYFTFTVAPPNSVLLLVEAPNDAYYLREALCPQFLPEGVEARFECSIVRYAELPRVAADDYDAVIAVDPGGLSADAYEALANYATRGGGLAIVLGRRSQRMHWSQSAAVGLLPGPLARQSRDESQLEIPSVDHPLLTGFRDVLDLASWSSFPVYRYWQFADLDSSAHAVVRLANGDPLIVEHRMGQGHVITITTPLAGPGSDNVNANWNLLPVALDEQPWPFFVLANGLASYLASTREGRLNYLSGEAAVLPLAPAEHVANFALALPDGVIEKRSLAPTLDDIVITDTSAIGHYRVLAGGQQSTLNRGFSVNASSRFSQLARIDRDQLLETLGKDRVKLAETRQEIDVRVGQARFGSELFGWLVALLVMVLIAEHLLSNRFYRQTS